MKTGRCPKCRSTNVRKQPKITRDSLMVGWRSAALDRYVCVSCGYTERYIGDRDRLSEIERSWPLAIQ